MQSFVTKGRTSEQTYAWRYIDRPSLDNQSQSTTADCHIGSSWIHTVAIYEIFALTFRHGKKEETDTFGHYGNIQGIREKLDYIKSLGVDAIWLTPIYDSPLKDGFGYNVSNYRKIHPIFGTEEEFNLLVLEVHARGMKLIMDLVFNHTSDQHEWFLQSKSSKTNKYADYYVWANPKYDESSRPLPPNNWLSMDIKKPSAWHWVEERGQYYLHSFNRTMPDLNINNEVVQNELMAIADFWLERGVDGFRIDAVPHMAHDPELRDNPMSDSAKGYHDQHQQYTTRQPAGVSFLKKLKTRIQRFQKSLPTTPHIIYTPALLGEVIADVAYADWLITEQALDVVYTGRLCGNLFDFQSIVKNTFHAPPQTIRMNWAMSNHDMPRVLDRTMGDLARPEHARLYMGMMVSLPGSICLFQGDELGLRQGKLAEIIKAENDPLGLAKSFMTESDSCRAGLPWKDKANQALWMSSPAINENKYPEIQAFDQDSPLYYTRKLLRFRNEQKALKSMSAPLFIDSHDSSVLCFLRVDPDSMEQVLCVFNFDTYPKHIEFKGKYLTGEEGTCSVDCQALSYSFKDEVRITQISCNHIETQATIN